MDTNVCTIAWWCCTYTTPLLSHVITEYNFCLMWRPPLGRCLPSIEPIWPMCTYLQLHNKMLWMLNATIHVRMWTCVVSHSFTSCTGTWHSIVMALCAHRLSLLLIGWFSEVFGLRLGESQDTPWLWEVDQIWSSRGSKSRNKVSVGEPAEGSLPYHSEE